MFRFGRLRTCGKFKCKFEETLARGTGFSGSRKRI
jgi:hypothetical protein